MLSRPSDGDLPTGQRLEANGKPAADTIRDGQRPVTLARASEPLNRHLKLNVPGMATWKGDQLGLPFAKPSRTASNELLAVRDLEADG